MSSILWVLFSMGVAGAMVIPQDFPPCSSQTYQWSPGDLYDLSHGSYYTWGIDWSIPQGEKIVGASLFFDNIRNWKVEENDLWVHLLEHASVGVTVGTDNQGGGDYFSGQGVLLNHWKNLPNTSQDINYLFDSSEVAALNAYAADGNFGLGFDPDCHFYNDGLTLKIETSATPIPGSYWLLASGLVGLVGVRRMTGKGN